MEFSRLQIASNWKLLPFSNFLQKVNIHAWFFLPMFLLSYLVSASHLLRPLLIRNAGRTQFFRHLLQHVTPMDFYEISMIASIVLLE
ncbi:hypothetical protein CFRS1_v008491 [Colletotrichum fructicola]|nr:hypothetical protein CFRS1_v008491 [Colletotrichum fructicola]